MQFTNRLATQRFTPASQERDANFTASLIFFSDYSGFSRYAPCNTGNNIRQFPSSTISVLHNIAKILEYKADR
ncbi:MAG: hypothetical protein [Olavius algarvensis spirochete endosymbiont]|nr:MAG: hypothetical protein [Olavius algarvensis spirochete endosymbiont]